MGLGTYRARHGVARGLQPHHPDAPGGGVQHGAGRPEAGDAARGMFPPSNRIRTTSVSLRPAELSAWQQARITAARAAAWARSNWAGAHPRTTTPATAPYSPTGQAHARR